MAANGSTRCPAPRFRCERGLWMTGPMAIDRARIEEVQRLAAEYRREATEGGTPVEPPMPSGALFWIARDGQRQDMGYAAGTLRPEGLVLGPVYVRPDHRRSGVGLRLLHQIQQWAQRARIPLVEVSVASDNDAGVRFLESAGYRIRRHLMAREDGHGGRQR
ncbi:MAG: GNAT family N-acetyltransferase [Nitriliruptorales bacterium]|nr:GNAT family N-acetyltransferase [Nitriliruptorales bacterium]